jgi:hypothetical protein
MTDPGQSDTNRSWLLAVCPNCGTAEVVDDGEWRDVEIGEAA